MTKAEKFVNDFMIAFDENGLGAPEKVMYLRAYQELKILQELKAKNLFIADVVFDEVENCTKCLKPKRMKPNTIQMLCECDTSEQLQSFVSGFYKWHKEKSGYATIKKEDWQEYIKTL